MVSYVNVWFRFWLFNATFNNVSVDIPWKQVWYSLKVCVIFIEITCDIPWKHLRYSLTSQGPSGSWSYGS
jgi:hypothetical protein